LVSPEMIIQGDQGEGDMAKRAFDPFWVFPHFPNAIR